jgi:hypothetical protein
MNKLVPSIALLLLCIPLGIYAIALYYFSQLFLLSLPTTIVIAVFGGAIVLVFTLFLTTLFPD